ncbi:hypothetical protein M422DRAFT_268434 [Sphaerobolus stellatus SS14]|uniref:Uncharacterized protein n=1 Tax=Sphaerobolus stellatus (strain SS14) TaxID=990650 RepID=A0A0C9UY90_SPHS4|nr:hypothetical protein M422DRAFT_268434 [Sphaerobolus stellatus SS14]
MTSKSKNTSKPLEAVKRPAFRFRNSPPPATSLSNRKACYTLKHGEVVEPLVSDHKSRTPQPQPIMSSTTTISFEVQEAPADTTLASDAVTHNHQGIQHHQGMIGFLTRRHDSHPNHLPDHLLKVEEEVEVIQILTTLMAALIVTVITTGNIAAGRSTITIQNLLILILTKTILRKGIKLRDPDTYDGSNPEKLKSFYSCALWFSNGAALEYFELAVMADYPNKDDQPVYLLYWVKFVEEPKMEKHHQATRFFISFAKYKANSAYNHHGYYCLVMNAMPDWILEELHRVFPMPKSYETLCSMTLQIDQHYWSHKKIMDLH